jgi:hypothetical protein
MWKDSSVKIIDKPRKFDLWMKNIFDTHTERAIQIIEFMLTALSNTSSESLD